MYPQPSPFDNIKNFFRQGSALPVLIIINVAVFLLINIIHLFFWLFTISPEMESIAGASKVTYWLAVPADLHQLLLKPWTLLTYMFVQEGFLHLLFNMIMLYFGGIIFLQFLNKKRLINTYIWGGIAGALFYIISFNVFPVFKETISNSIAIGASASVLAILIAISTFRPNHVVHLFLFGRVKLKYIAILFVVIDLLSINRGNPGGHIAHLGGALWGFLSIQWSKSRQTGFFTFRPGGLKRFFQKFRRKPRITYSRYSSADHPLTDEEYNRIKAEKQKKIDLILDKISKSGYDSLTKEEKELLFRASNKE